MRLLSLYVRSRRVPAALAAAVGSTAALAALAWLVDGFDDGMLARWAVVAGITVAGPGLAGADVDLDRTAPLAWLPWRAAHVVLAGGAVGAVTLAAFAGQLDAPAVILRDAAGASGLVAFGVLALGGARAWLVPVAWTLFASTLGPAGPSALPQTVHGALAWIVQPANSAAAATAAWAIAATGIVGYALLGPRR